MPHIKKSALVPYTQEQMYQLVDAVDRYPEFIPWCHSTEIITRTEQEVQATLCLAQKGIKKSFTTRNRLEPNSLIELRLINGPFKHLEGHWRFIPEHEGCRVSLDLEFEFNSGWLAALFAPAFNQAANTLVDLFCERANKVYGQS